MVPEVLGETTRDNPEDFVAIEPGGRLTTVNSKASITEKSCRLLRTGHLAAPRLARGQNKTYYATRRAQLISPIDGHAFAQVIKVDLLHLLAQVFEIEIDGRMSRASNALDISTYVDDVLLTYPDRVPAPNVWDLT